MNKKFKAYTLLELIVALALMSATFLISGLAISNMGQYLLIGFESKKRALEVYSQHINFSRDLELSNNAESQNKHLTIFNGYLRSLYIENLDTVKRIQSISLSPDTNFIAGSKMTFLDYSSDMDKPSYIYSLQSKSETFAVTSRVKKEIPNSTLINKQIQSGRYRY